MGSVDLMRFWTSFSKHFTMIGVTHTGQTSLRQDTFDFFENGVTGMTARLRKVSADTLTG